ncbi:MAG: protein phosphatase 2C domain-containing protein [Helicobacteraceae bacterium]|jgi:hypothetical protein|nr:protein phosphatase 2C domain-containing protein [Helicobacteraceae bacterium]
MASKQHAIEDISFKIFRITANQQLLLGGEIDDSNLNAFSKCKAVVEAVKKFAEQVEKEWTEFKKGEKMNPHVQGAQKHKANQAATSAKEAPSAGFIPTPQPIRFCLPNAKKGEPYKAVISAVDEESIKVTDIKGLEEIGFAFNPETQEVSGDAQKSGEFKLSLKYKRAKEAQTEDVVLIINPDPRDLWQENEPEEGQTKPKAHTDSKIIMANDVYIVAASRRGRSHAHVGSFRDDDFRIEHSNGWNVLVVADGAGSAKLSRIGSKEASNAICDIVTAELKGEYGDALLNLINKWDDEAKIDIQSKMYRLFQKAAKNAVEIIETSSTQDYSAQPRDMATTLLAAITRKVGAKVFIASFWVGDGAIAAYSSSDKTTIRILGVPDEGEYAGQTRFLDCSILKDEGFSKRIKIGLLPKVTAIFLMTDGVSDPQFETENGLNDPSKWDALWQEIKPILLGEKPDEKLLEWLNFWSPGNHDDRTIAIQWFGD